jgi:hypothetical protein
MSNSRTNLKTYPLKHSKNSKKKSFEIFSIIAKIIETGIGKKASQKQIAKKLNWSTSRLRYHLRILLKHKYLHKERIGRSVFYSINTSVVDTEKTEVRHITQIKVPPLQFIYVTYDILKRAQIKTTNRVNRGRYYSYKHEELWKGLDVRIEYFKTKVRIEFRNYEYDPQVGFRGQVLKHAHAYLTSKVMTRFPQFVFGNPRISHTHAPIRSETAGKVLRQARLDHIDTDIYHIDRTGPRGEGCAEGGFIELTDHSTFEEIMKFATLNRGTLDKVVSQFETVMRHYNETLRQQQTMLKVIDEQNQTIKGLQEEIALLRQNGAGASNPEMYV